MNATVLQLSDTHLSSGDGTADGGPDPDDRLATVLDAWSALGERADLVVLSGDNADDASRAGCRRLAEAVNTLDAPVLAVPGNHDDPAAVAEVFGPQRFFELGEWCVVGLDSSRPGQVAGTLDVPSALELIDRTDGRPTVMALHHPPVSRSTSPWFQLEGAADLLAGLERRPNVRVVISGHLHDAFELEGPGGVGLLGCPSTRMAIAHRGQEMEIGADAPTGARILRLADDGAWSSTVLVA